MQDLSVQQWLLQHRTVKVSERKKPFATKALIVEEVLSSGEIIKKKVEYRTYLINQTRKIKNKDKCGYIDIYADYFRHGKQGKIQYNDGWTHSKRRLSCDEFIRHVRTGRGTFGFVANEHDPFRRFSFIQADYDIKDILDQKSFEEKLKQIQLQYASIGTVVFTNICLTETRGFHVFVSLFRRMTLVEIDEYMANVKRNDDWCDKYTPNGHNTGVRLPFSFDRWNIDHKGRLVQIRSSSQLQHIIDAGSSLKKVNKVIRALSLRLKNETPVKKTKKTAKKVSDAVKLKGNWINYILNVYENGANADPVRAGGSVTTFRFAACSGYLKLMIMRGDNDTEIVNSVLTSTYVLKNFKYTKKELLRDIKICRIEVDQENDAIAKIYNTNLSLANALLRFFDTGDKSQIASKIETLELDERSVRQLSDWLTKNNFFVDMCFSGSAQSYATVIMNMILKGGTCGRNYIKELLRMYGCKTDNNHITALKKWCENKNFMRYYRSYGLGAMRGKASSIEPTDFFLDIIAIRDEIAKIDSDYAREIVAAIDDTNISEDVRHQRLFVFSLLLRDEIVHNGWNDIASMNFLKLFDSVVMIE